MSDIANGMQSYSSHFNTEGERLVTAEQARCEAYIDEWSWLDNDDYWYDEENRP